jgi:hypothetical protein
VGKKTVVVVGLAAVAGVAVGYLLPREDPTEYDSVAFLVDALAERGVECGGELRVHASRGIEGELDTYENGWCPKFDGDDQGDFFTFDDESSRNAYVEESKERTGTTSLGVSGVVGSNWIVSVRLEETARRVQAAIGGEVVGY